MGGTADIRGKKTYPNNDVGNRTLNSFNGNIMSYYRRVLQRRQKHQTLNKLFHTSLKRQKKEVTPESQLLYVIMEWDAPSNQ